MSDTRDDETLPMRGDDSPIAADDVEGLAILEASAAEMGKLYLRDWLDGLTEEERADFGAELLAEIEQDAAPAKPQPAPKALRDLPANLDDLDKWLEEE